MRRVLMVSPHFPPDTSAGAHRVRLLAPSLVQYGWEPTVVTVDVGAYEGRLDRDLARLVPGDLRVVRVPALSPRLTRLLRVGDLGLRSFLGLKNACDVLLRKEPFDALFVTIYPTYPALLGPLLKKRYGVPFVLDYQDPWVGSWGVDVGGGPGGAPDVKSRLSRLLATMLEPIAVRAADGLTAVSARTYEDVLARVRGAAPRACAAIPLGVEPHDMAGLQQLPRPNRFFDSADGAVHVAYVGTLLPKGVAMLRAVMTALAQLRTEERDARRLRLHFIGTSNQRDPAAAPRVLPIAAELGVADAVTEIAPRVDYLDALNAQAKAHAVLLVGSSEAHYTPSKVFPALLTGRPLLALYHAESPVFELLRAVPRARAIAVHDDEPVERVVPSLVDALRHLLAAPSEPAVVDEQVVGDWSAQRLAARLASVLDAVVTR